MNQTDDIIKQRQSLINIFELIDRYENEKTKLVQAEITLKEQQIKRSKILNFSLIAVSFVFCISWIVFLFKYFKIKKLNQQMK